jgi:hypothetical protein
MSKWKSEKNVQDSPLDVKEGDVIEALDDLPLHLIKCCHTPCHMEIKLCRPPILFDKIKFTMVFWIEIAEVPTRLDQLLKLGRLRDEIWLQKKNAPAAAVSATRGATKTRALGEKVSFLRP